MSFRSGLIRLQSLRRASHNASRVLAARPNSTVARDPSALSFTLLQKLKSKDALSAIHIYYPALVTELRKVRTTSPLHATSSPLNQHQFIALLEVLGSSGRPADLQRIEEILNDMSTLFNMKPNTEVHTAIIQALIKHGNVHTIHRWLTNMSSRPGNFTPTLEQFHIVLEACIDLASFKFMRNLVRSMRQYGCKPTNETYHILIRGRWNMALQEEKIPHIIVFSSILDDMKQGGLPYDPAINALLRESYAEQGLTAYADQIQTLYQSLFPDLQTPHQQQHIEWMSELSLTAQSGGVKAAIVLFRSRERDKPISPPAIRSILRHAKTIGDLRIVEKEFMIQADVVHWSILISNNVRAGHLSDALSIYQETKNAGIVPDAALVGPLIKALCRSTFKPPSDDSLDNALSIYKDLVESSPPSSTDTPSRGSGSEDRSSGPDADIYQNLLRGLAKSTNIDKYFPIAKSLMEDMESRDVPLNNSLTASSNIVLLMRRSSSLDEAFEVYKRMRLSLDEKGYAVVLNAFCKLSFGNGIQIPSLTSYFEIVKDMRRAGLEITVEVYTIILHQLGIVATKMRDPAHFSPDIQERLITTTRRTHDLLTLDAAVSPDAQVWNQLMDTYQRLGCFGDSYRVWDMMYLSGRFDHVSVSIILDACGYAGAWQVAKKITTSLFNDRFSFNLHNWNSWLECLCRLDRLNDAVKVACMEMGRDQNTVAPDIESARILIKFARKAKQQIEVLERLRHYLPELWEALPQDLRQP